MTEILLGMAMMISSTGVSPALEASPAKVAPAVFTNFELPADPAPPSILAVPRPSSRAQVGQARRISTRRFSMTERIIATAAGLSVGWVVGGIVGGKITESDNPNDDTSVLKGIFIGAPIGGAAGAILGWRLTK